VSTESKNEILNPDPRVNPKKSHGQPFISLIPCPIHHLIDKLQRNSINYLGRYLFSYTFAPALRHNLFDSGKRRLRGCASVLKTYSSKSMRSGSLNIK